MNKIDLGALISPQMQRPSLIPGDMSHELYKAGILTPGSFSVPHLPNLIGQWYLQPSSPVTAAGPFLIHTGFPLYVCPTPYSIKLPHSCIEVK
jgi:hypothetical protein